MDENMLFIPPCCVDKKLPQAIMQAPRNALSFYTHGDVIMESFYKSISHLVDSPHVMVLTMTIADSGVIAYILLCFERGWISNLILSTQRDCTPLLDKYLADYRNHILYACSTDVNDTSSHLVLYTDQKALSIAGPMHERPYQEPTVAYTMLFHPRMDIHSSTLAHGNPLLNILVPDVLRHRKAYRAGLARELPNTLVRFLAFDFPPYKE